MKIWLGHHGRTLGATIGRLARTPVASLLNIGVIGIALALPVGLYAGLANLQRLAGEFPADPQLSLFLALDSGPRDMSHIENRLKQHAGVRNFRYVPRDEALREMKMNTGLADVVDSLGHNPLPDVFIVDARDGAPQALEDLRIEFRKWPKVAQVQLDSVWAKRLDAVIRLGRLTLLLLGALLAFALVAITFNTIRLQIMTRREEIEVARLIGATDPFIRRPFLYYGALLGLAGGSAAWAVVWASIALLNGGLADLSELYGARLRLRPLTPADSLSLLLFSTWLGWLGAWLSVNRHLSQMAPR